MTSGGLEGSPEGPGSIFNRFWMPFGGPLGHHFLKKSALGTVFLDPGFRYRSWTYFEWLMGAPGSPQARKIH